MIYVHKDKIDALKRFHDIDSAITLGYCVYLGNNSDYLFFDPQGRVSFIKSTPGFGKLLEP